MHGWRSLESGRFWLYIFIVRLSPVDPVYASRHVGDVLLLSISEFAAECLSAENPLKKIWLAEFAAEFCLPKIRGKNTDIWIVKWNQHSSNWLASLACYLKWNILAISKLLVIKMDAGFVTAKRQTSTSFTLAVISVFSRKMFVISRFLAEVFSLHENSANPNVSQIFFSAICIYFRLQIRGLCSITTLITVQPLMRGVCRSDQLVCQVVDTSAYYKFLYTVGLKHRLH